MGQTDNQNNQRPLNPQGNVLKAAAIHYDGGAAPQVVAKGQGYVADKILSKAKEGDIPIYQNPELAEELTKLDLGDMIPPELYEVVAQILVFVSDLDRVLARQKE